MEIDIDRSTGITVYLSSFPHGRGMYNAVTDFTKYTGIIGACRRPQHHVPRHLHRAVSRDDNPAVPAHTPGRSFMVVDTVAWKSWRT